MNQAYPEQHPSLAQDPTGFQDFLPYIEKALTDGCQFGKGCPDRLANAMRYSVLAPGKRLRPALVLMAAEACGGSIEDALPGAVAVEMIHAYSLIHDDLPAMDDDDLRRGRPTCHIEFDEATAILAGDALIPEAFSHLCQKIADPTKLAQTVRCLATAAGATQLVGGQADDLAAEAKATDLESSPATVAGNLRHLESIHQRKTGALISASLEIGAILGAGNKTQRHALANYAKLVGLAFQVVDDLLDWTSDATTMGKRTGKDAEKGKLTYPGLLGVEGAKKRAKQLVDDANLAISVFEERKWRLSSLATYVLERQH